MHYILPTRTRAPKQAKKPVKVIPRVVGSPARKPNRLKAYRSQHNMLWIIGLIVSLVVAPPLTFLVFIAWILNCFEVKRANRKIAAENQQIRQTNELVEIKELLKNQSSNKYL